MDNTTYEFFIRRAWKCERFQKGANTDTWEGLISQKFDYQDAIGKPTEAKEKLQYDREFAQIKNYVDAAYVNLLYRATKTNNNEELVNSFLDLKAAAGNSQTPEELFAVLKRSFSVLNDNGL